MKQFVLLLLLIPFVSADVVIYQVLYDPINTEKGGEAVELRNTGNSPVDISGWVLATASSPHDATLPEGSIIPPGETFLVTDEDWEREKDNSNWATADYKEKLTIGNKDSGVALVSNDVVIDAVGWGSADKLYQGSPTSQVEQGKSLLRISNTGDNSQDFIEAEASFFAGIPVQITADVSILLPEIEVSDKLNLAPEGTLIVKNNGNQAITVKLNPQDLFSKENTIPKENFELEDNDFVIQAYDERQINVRIRSSKDTVPGKYSSTMRVLISYYGT